jgi:hypothetical protein
MKGLRTDTSESLYAKLETLEAATTRWLARWSITILRVSLGSILLGFGLLKFFPGMSPAEGLVAQTLDAIAFGISQRACASSWWRPWNAPSASA